MPKPKLGADAASRAFRHRHTAAQAVTEAHGVTPAKSKRKQAWPKVTNIRLSNDQWLWLRKQALAYAMETGRRADASEVMRELIDRAMAEGGERK